MKELLEGLIEKFNRKALNDPKLRRELEGVERKVVIDCTDGPKFNFILKDCQIKDFSEGSLDAPDIRIISDTVTLKGLINKEMGPMKALATRKLQIKASLDDMLRLRKLF